jgi:hypothetical protein
MAAPAIPSPLRTKAPANKGGGRAGTCSRSSSTRRVMALFPRPRGPSSSAEPLAPRVMQPSNSARTSAYCARAPTPTGQRRRASLLCTELFFRFSQEKGEGH